jgi:hypothetical protein
MNSCIRPENVAMWFMTRTFRGRGRIYLYMYDSGNAGTSTSTTLKIL